MGRLFLLAVGLLLGALCINHLMPSISVAGAAARSPELHRAKRASDLLDMLPDRLEPFDIIVIICNSNQDTLDFCSTVPTFMERFGGGRDSGPASRKKRSFPSFSPNFNSFPSFPSTSRSFDEVSCPKQVNQSEVYRLSSNSEGYPIADIATELANDPTLTACLLREVVLDNSPPDLIEDNFFSMSNATCPFRQLRLFNFFSVTRNTRCFVLLNFQEDLLYKECLAMTPTNCERDRFGDFGDFDSIFGRNATRRENRCTVEYERVSLWAYCPALRPGRRIVRDRIILPKACTPFSVPCLVTRKW